MRTPPCLADDERYLVIDDTDENASQIIYVAFEGYRRFVETESQVD